MSIEELEKAVIEWARKRDLYRQSTDNSRWNKLQEELYELSEEWTTDPVHLELVKMEAGDVLVTLINFLHPFGLDLKTCLSAAYEKIKNRTGHMENGTFVRDEE